MPMCEPGGRPSKSGAVFPGRFCKAAIVKAWSLIDSPKGLDLGQIHRAGVHLGLGHSYPSSLSF